MFIIRTPIEKFVLIAFISVLPVLVKSQTAACSNLTVRAVANESRCRSTGSITISTTGGSGQFNFRAIGPASTPFTSSNVISGLPPGTYQVQVFDVIGNCSRSVSNIVIAGSYIEPRFSLLATDATCMNAPTGSIRATGITGGRAPFAYRIMSAPSPGLVGTTSPTGVFTNLPAGDYSIQMTDSCGGIQTRQATILPYTWRITASGGRLTGCGVASLFLNLEDNRGRRSGMPGDAVFSSFQYGWVRGPRDTVWNNTNNFTANIGTRRSVMLVVRDGCGNRANVPWSVNPVPVVGSVVPVTTTGCNQFTASVSGTANLTNPTYCLLNSSNVQISCNSTGTFTRLGPGSYSIRVRDACYDTTINVRFSISASIPSMDAGVGIVRQTCSTFTASALGVNGFTNPSFCLYRGATRVTCNTTGRFANLPNGSYRMEVRDGCYDTTIIRNFSVAPLVPSVSGTVSLSNYACSTFTASVTGRTNLTNPVFTLLRGTTQIASNGSGVFGNIPYGNYCIRIRNSAACYDTTIVLCFSGNRILPSVANSLGVTRRCDDVDITVQNPVQLYNPRYCIYDANGVLISCNGTGVFNGLPYGNYCVRIINDPACYDTTIVRCANISRAAPAVGAVVVTDNRCDGFSTTVTGAVNLSNPRYILRSSSGTPIDSNSTGIFTNLPYGSYCMDIRNSAQCYDTTIRRCFSANRSLPGGGVVNITNLRCTGFTASMTGLVNMNNPVYRLVDANGTVIDNNSTGVFNINGFGRYCIQAVNNAACYDTVISRCFNPVQPQPSVGTVAMSNFTCSGFNAVLQGQRLLTNPVFNVLNTSGLVIATNSTGSFSGLPYGAYTMQVIDACRPTPFLVPFAAARPQVAFNAVASASCLNGNTDVLVNVTGGRLPYIVSVFDPLNTPVYNTVSSSNFITIPGLPGLSAGMGYTVTVTDACGTSSSSVVMPLLTSINTSIGVEAKCPTGLLPQGSSDVTVTLNSNLPNIIPVIIKADGRDTLGNYTIQRGNQFTFMQVPPGTYVLRYDVPARCAAVKFDTVRVSAYQFPNLANSTVFQCSNNSFTVGTQMVGGTAPYQYQIIGSLPATPSIATGWQASPLFSIDNGQTYSLVRLRGIDACGNASLSDASVLPLENFVITSSSICVNAPVTLSATIITNGLYRWFKVRGSDSTLVGTGPVYSIPFLTLADTGRYVVRMTVNNGCLTEESSFDVRGDCILLPVASLVLKGEKSGSEARLSWRARGENSVSHYELERRVEGSSAFVTVGRVDARQPLGNHDYSLPDPTPLAGTTWYRVRAIDRLGNSLFSNQVQLVPGIQQLRVHPVPARTSVHLSFSGTRTRNLRYTLLTVKGQVILENSVSAASATVTIPRGNLAPGIYFLRITDLSNGQVQMEKILFE